MTVTVTWEVPPEGLTDDAARAAVEAALVHGERPGIELSLVFVSDTALAELHADFLDDPSVTDVMAFDLGEGPGPLGEVVVSVDRAREVAARRGVTLARELALYAVHGTLHLCGYDDHEDRDRDAMRAAERTVLAQLGYGDDTAPHDEER